MAAFRTRVPILMRFTLGGKPWIIGAEVADDMKCEGKAKGLVDLKPGDTVTLPWVRREQGDVA